MFETFAGKTQIRDVQEIESIEAELRFDALLNGEFTPAAEIHVQFVSRAHVKD
jgi:hypothetical protein